MKWRDFPHETASRRRWSSESNGFRECLATTSTLREQARQELSQFRTESRDKSSQFSREPTVLLQQGVQGLQRMKQISWARLSFSQNLAKILRNLTKILRIQLGSNLEVPNRIQQSTGTTYYSKTLPQYEKNRHQPQEAERQRLIYPPWQRRNLVY